MKLQAIKNANLLSCDDACNGEPVPRSTVVFDETIRWVGKDDEVPKALWAQVSAITDAEGCALLPALVDAHTHIMHAGSRIQDFHAKMSGMGYQEIAANGGGIMRTVRATRAATDETLLQLAKERLLIMQSHGVGTVEIKTGYGLSVHEELRMLRLILELQSQMRMRILPTLLAAHVVPVGQSKEAYVQEIVCEILPEALRLCPRLSVDVYVEGNAFSLDDARKIWERTQALGGAVRGHVGQFSSMGGAQLVSDMGGLSADHLEFVTEVELEAMAKSGTVAMLLPGAWNTLRQDAPQAERFRKHGVKMAVATDANPGTSPIYDLTMCLSLAVRQCGLLPYEGIVSVTKHAADALGLPQHSIEISVGAAANLLLLPDTNPYLLGYSMGTHAKGLWLQGHLCLPITSTGANAAR